MYVPASSGEVGELRTGFVTARHSPQSEGAKIASVGRISRTCDPGPRLLAMRSSDPPLSHGRRSQLHREEASAER